MPNSSRQSDIGQLSLKAKADKLQTPKMSTMNPMKKIKTVTISHVASYKTRKATNKSPIVETFNIDNLEIENPNH